MSQYFSAAYSGPPFILFGQSHLFALSAIALLNISLLQFKNSSRKAKRTIRWTLASILWIDEIAWHIWNLAVGTWKLQTMLPFNICSVFIWLSGFMLIFRNYTIYEFSYFLGIGGAIQYLITPDLGIFGFPHFRFFQAFISHGLVVTAAVYLTVVEGLRPTWKSLRLVLVVTNLYMLAVYIINLGLGSDYLMLNAKPATPSLLDLLPPWPIYILYMELIGFLTFLMLYLPFVIKDRILQSSHLNP